MKDKPIKLAGLTESEILSAAAKIRGSRGGKAGTGAVKARTSEQARKAAMAGWAKRKARKVTDPAQ